MVYGDYYELGENEAWGLGYITQSASEETEKVAEKLQVKYTELTKNGMLYNMDDIIDDYEDSLTDGAEEFINENEHWLLCEVA